MPHVQIFDQFKDSNYRATVHGDCLGYIICQAEALLQETRLKLCIQFLIYSYTKIFYSTNSYLGACNRLQWVSLSLTSNTKLPLISAFLV